MKKLEQPIYTSVPKTNSLQLHEEYLYSQFGLSFTIPKDFIWDGASIPRIFWLSTGSNYDPKYTLPALIHDYLYKAGICSKRKADLVFLRELNRSGVDWYTRHKMYIGVVWGGGEAWNEYRKKEKINKWNGH